MVVRIRVRLPDLILGQRVEELIFTLKAPLVGWREASRSLPGLRRFAEIASYAPSARAYGRFVRRGGLVFIASRIEGGGSIEAYFQQLLTEVKRRLNSDTTMADELLNIILVSIVTVTMIAGLGMMGILSVIVMGLMGLTGLLFMPRAHYFIIDDADILGIIVGIVASAAAWILVDGYLALAVGLLAYGLVKLPSLIYDMRLRASMPIRVTMSFNELLTKPSPTPIRDLSPIEAGLMPLWREAKKAGAPQFIGWSNVLVGEYIGAVQNILTQGLLYGALTVGVGGAFSIGLMGYLTRVIQYGMLTQAPVSLSFLLNMPQGAFYSAVGSGLAGGMVIMDWRLGALLGGALGIVAWFVLHSVLLIA